MRSRLVDWIHELPFSVATKISVTVTAGALLALALVSGGLALHERRALVEASERQVQAQVDALAPLVAESWMRDGPAHARSLLEAANASNPRMRLDLVEETESLAGGPGDDVARGVASFPISAHGEPEQRWLIATTQLPPLGLALVEAIEAFVAAALPLGVFALLIAYSLGEWLVGAPLRRVVARARGIGAGRLHEHLSVRGSAELVALKDAINEMMDALRASREAAKEEARRRLDAVETLRHADRLTTVGTLSAGVAHELGTPLNVIVLESQMSELAVATDPARAIRGLTTIRQQAARMTTIVRQLLDFARRKEPLRERCSAIELAANAASLVGTLGRSARCTVEVEHDEDVVVDVDPVAVQQVLTNLFVNAFDAMQPDGGEVRVDVQHCVRARRLGSDLREWACVRVHDEGRGIDEATRVRIFEPFFTTKEVGKGTGLGLSVALGIVEDHGGFIEVESNPSGGATFSLFLPLASAPCATAPRLLVAPEVHAPSVDGVASQSAQT